MRILRVIGAYLWSGASYRVRCNLLIALWSKDNGYERLSKYFHRRLQRYGVYISYGATFNNTIRFPHPVGIVIGEGVVLGNNLVVYQNVTIGGHKVGAQSDRDYPTVGDGVIIYAGAVVLGGINVGTGAVIGANSVVIRDVLPYTLNVGVPSRVVKR